MRRFLFSSLALSACAFRNYAVYAHRGKLVPAFMLSVKALAESDAKQEPPVLFGPRDPCEEYAHFDQPRQCMAYGSARGRGTKWKDEMEACHTCVFWRLAAMEDDPTFRDRSRSCDAAGDKSHKTSLLCTYRDGLFGILLKDWGMFVGVLMIAYAAFIFYKGWQEYGDIGGFCGFVFFSGAAAAASLVLHSNFN